MWLFVHFFDPKLWLPLLSKKEVMIASKAWLNLFLSIHFPNFAFCLFNQRIMYRKQVLFDTDEYDFCDRSMTAMIFMFSGFFLFFDYLLCYNLSVLFLSKHYICNGFYVLFCWFIWCFLFYMCFLSYYLVVRCKFTGILSLFILIYLANSMSLW